MKTYPSKCVYCGRFISGEDFREGRATEDWYWTWDNGREITKDNDASFHKICLENYSEKLRKQLNEQ